MTISRRRRAAALATTFVLATGGLVAVAAPAHALDITISDISDLPASVVLANTTPGPDRITIDSPINQTLVTATTITITEDLIIEAVDAPAGISNNAAVAFEITGAGSVTLSRITAFSSTTDGILSTDTDLTLENLLISSNGGHGLDFSGGDLTLTGVTANNNTETGVFLHGDAGPVRLTDVTANGNDSHGIFLRLDGPTPADAVLTGVTANENGTAIVGQQGLRVIMDAGGSLTATNTTTDRNTDIGTFLDVEGGSATVTTLSAQDNDVTGFLAQTTGGSLIQASGVTANGNGDRGMYLYAGLGTIQVSDSTTSFNGGSLPLGIGGGIFARADDGTLALDDITAEGNQSEFGAGIGIEAINGGSSITVSNSTIIDNIGVDGTGVYAQAIGAGSSLTIEDTTISGNSATSIGGGIYLLQSGDAGGGASVVIERSTVAGNTAITGAGIVVQSLFGNVAPTPVFELTDSTVSGNTGGVAGLVLQSSGPSDVIADIVGSTFSGNSGDHTVYFDESGTATLRANISHSTVTANTVGGGGGISAIDGTIVEVSHVIAADNSGTDFFSDPASDFVIDYSLVSDTSGSAEAAAALGAGTGNVVGSADLGPLAANGGTTRTHLPIAGSAAIDAGQPAIVGAPAADQRGLARIVNGRIDIGAVEVAVVTMPATGRELTPMPLGLGMLLLAAGVALLGFGRREGFALRA